MVIKSDYHQLAVIWERSVGLHSLYSFIHISEGINVPKTFIYKRIKIEGIWHPSSFSPSSDTGEQGSTAYDAGMAKEKAVITVSMIAFMVM